MTKKQRETLIKDDTPQADAHADTTAASSATTSEKQEKIAKIEASSPDKAQDEKISKGEKIFNWTAYTGLNYFTNLILSIGLADYFIHLGGKKWLEARINNTTSFLRKFSVPVKTAHHNSKIGWETFILTSGGLALLAPLKLMEDNKRPIVHWLNKKLGIKQQTPDGKEKTPDEIHIEEEQPKQSWGNVIWRRILGTAAVVVTGLGLDHFARDKNKIIPPESYNIGGGEVVTYEKKVLGGKTRVTDSTFDWINKTVKNFRGKGFKDNGIVSRWTKLAILDAVFTVITAVVMKVTNGSGKGKMPKEIDNSEDPIVLKESTNKLVIENEQDRKNRIFSERVEKRAKELISYKRDNGLAGRASGSFVEAIKNNEGNSAALNAGM